MVPTHGEAFIAFHVSEEIILGAFFCRQKGFIPLPTGLFKFPIVFLCITGLILVIYHYKKLCEEAAVL